jgi:hypothetical protein
VNRSNALPGIQIDSPFVTPDALNFRPMWPPSDDFPVVIDSDDNVVSRFGDKSWNLAPWVGKSLSITFQPSRQRRGSVLDESNANLLRLVDAWWLWGFNAVQTAQTLARKHVAIKPIFCACSDAGIVASELQRFPKVIEAVAARITKGNGRKVLWLLHDLWTFRDILGFEILNQEGIAYLSTLISPHRVTQTAYIPPRIWSYHVQRLKECLDDYANHRDKVEDCFRFCMNAYAHNAGGLENAFVGTKIWYAPFHTSWNAGHVTESGRKYYGAFKLTAARFGIDGLLARWIDVDKDPGIRSFSTYLSMISKVGLAYVLNFSLMRIDEGQQLRIGCHSVEEDEFGDSIHLVSGVTTKTIEDGDARWIVSPGVEQAIGVMSSVALLRLEAAKHDPRVRLTPEDEGRPLLQSRQYEPWAPAIGLKTPRPGAVLKMRGNNYNQTFDAYPKLFDLDGLRMTEEDVAIARRMTFGLDPAKFAVGEVWPFTWHQFRRTGACNMLSTGMVSESSLQYQLKHGSRGMTRYYGQNYSKIRALLNEGAKKYFVREMYDALAREFSALGGDRFISPHGERRKAQLLQPLSEKDHRDLVKGAQTGTISYRENFFGGCVKPGAPCHLGGISNLTGCMGSGDEDPCPWVLLDRRRLPGLRQIRSVFHSRLSEAPPSSMLEESIRANIESVERAINVLETE